MYVRPFAIGGAEKKVAQVRDIWAQVQDPAPTLIRSTFDPRFNVTVSQAQTVPVQTVTPAAVVSPVVVQNPDGTYSAIPLTQSTMPPAAPELLDSEPGGSSGFNLPDRAAVSSFAVGEPVGSNESGVSATMLIGGALLLWLFLGSR